MADWESDFVARLEETIASLLDQNVAIERGATHRVKHGDGDWTDITQADYEANKANIDRLRKLVDSVKARGSQ